MPIKKSERDRIVAAMGDWSLLHLNEAVQRYPDNALLPYVRVSAESQVSRGDLKEQGDQFRELLEPFGREIYSWEFQVQESGVVGTGNQKLTEAVACARENGLILVAKDRSRLIRASKEQRRKSSKRTQYEPTIKEWFEFYELVKDVPTAVYIAPSLPLDGIDGINSEKQKIARQFSDCKPGPNGPDNVLISGILELRQEGCSFRNIATQLGIDKSKVQRVLEKEVPGWEGETWANMYRPFDYWCALIGAEDYAAEMQCSLF